MKLSYAVAMPDCRARKMLCFRGDFDPICRQLKAFGYDGVELFVRNPRELDHADIARTVTRHGLTVPDISTGQLAGEDGLSFIAPDPSVRGAARERARDVIDLAAHWQAQMHIGRFRGNLPEGEGASDAWKWMRDGFLEAADYGQPKGVRILLEPQCRFNGNNLFSVLEGIEFVRSLDHPNIGIVADTFHMNIEDVSLVGSLMAAKGYLTHMHFGDSNRWYPGAGHINFRDVLEALRMIGYDGFITMEIEQKPDSATAARRAAQTILALLGGLEPAQAPAPR
jgi:sugar phosphate isomerase/epimerase